MSHAGPCLVIQVPGRPVPAHPGVGGAPQQGLLGVTTQQEGLFAVSARDQGGWNLHFSHCPRAGEAVLLGGRLPLGR